MCKIIIIITSITIFYDDILLTVLYYIYSYILVLLLSLLQTDKFNLLPLLLFNIIITYIRYQYFCIFILHPFLVASSEESLIIV